MGKISSLDLGSPSPSSKDIPMDSEATLTPSTLTIRNPPFTYLHLTLLSSPPSSDPVDILTFRAHLTSALQQFLGLTGTAIPIDFLKVEDRDLWVRVPREDGSAVVNALSGWVGGSEREGVGWRVKGKGDWLGAMLGGRGAELFEA
ncbi:hypothetical protein MMC12_002043 [Toensbergia leucococca]|nr:hypothetical protein [Toensbergia leucococca]